MPSGRCSLERLEQELRVEVSAHYFWRLIGTELLPWQLPAGFIHGVAADG